MYTDIVSIKDVLGNKVEEETHIGNINPYRYRSYYYDKETNLYYLNSRYYNPVWGRFLNADGIIGTSENYLGYNLYAYCENNPAISVDSDGEFALTLALGAIAVGVFALGAYCGAKALQPVAGVVTKRIETVYERKKEKEREDAKKIEKANTKTAVNIYERNNKPCTEAYFTKGKRDVERGKRLTIEQSKIAIDTGNHVMCDNQFYALQVVMDYEIIIGPEIDKDPKPGFKYYYHYHPDRDSHRHIWFLGIPWSE